MAEGDYIVVLGLRLEEFSQKFQPQLGGSMTDYCHEVTMLTAGGARIRLENVGSMVCGLRADRFYTLKLIEEHHPENFAN